MQVETPSDPVNQGQKPQSLITSIESVSSLITSVTQSMYDWERINDEMREGIFEMALEDFGEEASEPVEQTDEEDLTQIRIGKSGLRTLSRNY